ncbi:MAG: acetyl-CoA acetyltransferase [Dehalococcoidia bacterium]
MVFELRKQTAIVGVYEHETRKATDKGRYQIIAECAERALGDAGLTKADVDGLYAYYFDAPTSAGLFLAEYLNINPRHVDSTSEGGSSFVAHLAHAAAAIATGQCNVALITYAATPRTGAGLVPSGEMPVPIPDGFTWPFGYSIVSAYALVAQRHMYEYGTTPEQLAEIAVTCRRNAANNPNARYRDPMTVEDVINSPMIASPLHRLDCCVISDGGGAVVVTSAERARDLKKPPVYVLGTGQACAHTGGGMKDFTSIAAKQSGAEAFQRAGVTRKDIDVAQIYDSFTITALCTIEDLGFCKKGEGGAYVQGGRIAPGGELPINTDGGGLSSNQPGERGIFLIIEAARQLWGESVNQVDNAKIALCHGTGGMGDVNFGATAILARD